MKKEERKEKMSRFYADIEGGRGQATRQGHKFIRGHIRGWNVGIEVIGKPNEETNEDTFTVYLTSGSGGGRLAYLLGKFTEKELDTRNKDTDISLSSCKQKIEWLEEVNKELLDACKFARVCIEEKWDDISNVIWQLNEAILKAEGD